MNVGARLRRVVATESLKYANNKTQDLPKCRRCRPARLSHPEEHAVDPIARHPPEEATGTEHTSFKRIGRCHQREAREEDNRPTEKPAHHNDIRAGINWPRPLNGLRRRLDGLQ
jgi:hypothetical protein